MVVYKAVDIKRKVESDLSVFVSNQYLKVKKDWGCSPNKYVVYKTISTGELAITKYLTASTWDEKEKGIEVLGKLGDLYVSLIQEENQNEEQTVYESKYNSAPKMEIRLGVPVRQARKLCDSNPAQDCSNGLHCGATAYIEHYYNSDEKTAILACYVNPAHIVAVPDYDHSKMRVCEYMPFAVATYADGKIDIIQQSYFESDYRNIEQEELKALIEKVQADELPYETAQNAKKEDRPMPELLKIIESRLIDLSDMEGIEEIDDETNEEY
jgi:hypothetical protein